MTGRDERAVLRCVDRLRSGRAVVVVGDTEGVLVMAARFVTTGDAAWFLRHTSGYFGVALTAERTRTLGLPRMVADPVEPGRPAFTVSVDAAAGITTGISAADRARTIRLLAAEQTAAADLTRPGHVSPLQASDGGVLARPGHAEAAVDLCTLAGLTPAALLCHLTTDDELDLLRGPDVFAFAAREDLPVVTIEQLVRHRRSTAPIERGASARIPTEYGTVTAIPYRSADGAEHLALVTGAPTADAAPVLVHHECLAGEVLRSTGCDCGARLSSGLAAITAAGSGVLVYLRAGRPDLVGCGLGAGAHDRDVAAAILRDLGVGVDGRAQGAGLLTPA
ncbi:3,4-dihydroxy-2-butanone-4-phosphate synthase [Rhodococcus sp. NPDC003318]|uniref:3,4-dihydroxy-2-butanone-4-phosphate synthase n=1 Tax=Rhodococcus sp. NPDC003318 TaxID=3364503 RepID=UPI0036A07D1F